MPNPVHEIIRLEGYEALTVGSDGRHRGKITIIKAGRSANRRNYRESVLRDAAAKGVYTGMRMFVDHSDKPPLKRSFNEMVSAVESTEWNDEKKAIDGTVVFFDPEFADKVEKAKEFMGVSVNHLLKGHRVRESDGGVMEDITEVVRGHSVDWVIYPAAGGEFQGFLESEGDDMLDWTKITADDIKKNAPDVYAELVKESKGPDDEPDDDNDEESNTPPVTKESVQSWVREAIQAERQSEKQATETRSKALSQMNEAVAKSGLPQVTRDRIVRSFTSMATESITEANVTAAVEEAKNELKALKVGPKITGMGSTQASTSSATEGEDGEPRLSGPSLSDAQESLAAAFAGFDVRGTSPKKSGKDDSAEGSK